VADKATVRAGVALQQKRQVSGEGPALMRGDEQPEAVGLDEVVELALIRLGECGRNVHRRPSRQSAGERETQAQKKILVRNTPRPGSIV
jgi:hypothetical protein